MNGQRKGKRIVVEGCGQWAMQYFHALKALAGKDIGVFFTFDSTFGLDAQPERLTARLYFDYLQATLRNVKTIQDAGFACCDVKDTLFKLQQRRNILRDQLPKYADAVLVVTPDRTHCDVAEYWLGRAGWIFVEKPFDVSAERVEKFCEKLGNQNYSRAFAVDHYFVRCNQAASDENFFLNRLLTTDGSGKVQNDLESFEFLMAESPKKDSKGNYDAASIRERALSLQEGMVFDMGSHGLPVLLPFIDIHKPIRMSKVWAGVSDALSEIIFSGAETFSIARVECTTRTTPSKPNNKTISGKFIIGKDIGQSPEKYLLVKGPKASIRFDLVNYTVYQEHADGRVEPVVPLQQDWVRFFVKEVLEGRIPKSVEIFEPQGALKMIETLESWRNTCQGSHPGAARRLQSYDAGMSRDTLEDDRYRML